MERGWIGCGEHVKIYYMKIVKTSKADIKLDALWRRNRQLRFGKGR